jgi:hypothetical protein
VGFLDRTQFFRKFPAYSLSTLPNLHRSSIFGLPHNFVNCRAAVAITYPHLTQLTVQSLNVTLSTNQLYDHHLCLISLLYRYAPLQCPVLFHISPRNEVSLGHARRRGRLRNVVRGRPKHHQSAETAAKTWSPRPICPRHIPPSTGPDRLRHHPDGRRQSAAASARAGEHSRAPRAGAPSRDRARRRDPRAVRSAPAWRPMAGHGTPPLANPGFAQLNGSCPKRSAGNAETHRNGGGEKGSARRCGKDRRTGSRGSGSAERLRV